MSDDLRGMPRLFEYGVKNVAHALPPEGWAVAVTMLGAEVFWRPARVGQEWCYLPAATYADAKKKKRCVSATSVAYDVATGTHVAGEWKDALVGDWVRAGVGVDAPTVRWEETVKLVAEARQGT